MNKSAIFTAMLLFAVVVPSFAAVHELADQRYDLAGEVVAKGVMVCGPVALKGGNPVRFENTVTLQFGSSDEAGGTFQLLNDNLLGEDLDGVIYGRKKNKLTLQYAGASTPEEAAGNLVGYAQQKAAELGSEFGGLDLTITGYSFTAVAKQDLLKVKERITMTAPYKGCTARVKIVRKVSGPVYSAPQE